MTAVYCVFCRTTVDRLVIDFNLSQWGMCLPCHTKAAGDLARTSTLFDATTKDDRP